MHRGTLNCHCDLWTNGAFHIGDEAGFVPEDSARRHFHVVPQLLLLPTHLPLGDIIIIINIIININISIIHLQAELCPILSLGHGDKESACNILNVNPERLRIIQHSTFNILN